MAVDFARHAQEWTAELLPCTWDYAKRIRDRDGKYVCQSDNDIALCTCANGHTTRMVSTVHRVAPDGTVAPSYVCPVKGCSFHQYVRLVGWDPSHVYEVTQWE